MHSKTENITATKLKRHSGEILRRVSQGGTIFIIERDSYTIAAIVPIKTFRQMIEPARDSSQDAEGA